MRGGMEDITLWVIMLGFLNLVYYLYAYNYVDFSRAMPPQEIEKWCVHSSYLQTISHCCFSHDSAKLCRLYRREMLPLLPKKLFPDIGSEFTSEKDIIMQF